MNEIISQITEAFASKNVTKNNATIEIERNMIITQGDIQNGKVQSNITCNCSKPIDSNQNVQIQCPNNNTAEASINCTNKIVANIEDKVEKQNNPTDNNDTIFKYLYKKNETNDPEKSKGHYKNSLRKKRSLTSQKALITPLIVNYETSHGPVKEREQWLPAKNTAHVIKGSDLADFNIETLHESIDGEKLHNNDHAHSKDDSRDHDHSGEFNERAINENERDSKESSEDKEKLHDSKGQEKGDSNERESHSSDESSRENFNLNNISNESDRNDDKSSESRERDVDDDDKNSYKDIDTKFTKSRSESDEKTENSQEKNENININLQNHKSPRDDSGEEKSQFIVHDSNKHDGIQNSSPPKIQDIDLDDFSYERIKLNENGKVESAGDANENKDVEIISTKKPQPFAKTHDETNYVPDESSETSSSIEANEPTHINDGEVKPVVEIHSEADSIESNEENSSLNNESLETLTGVKEDSNEKYDKLQESQDTGDVKQQFERIPLNYTHKNKNEANAKDSEQNEHSEHEDDEGTVDKLTPKHVRYDENLNIKFDDIAIKLPEIKLPEDILSYAYEDPPIYKKKDEKKQNFFHYTSQEDKEEPHEKAEPDDDDDDDSENYNDADKNYYGYYGNTKKQQAYKKHKNEAEEEDDDPYEKFVRERFGKKDTFAKRSEKIRDLGAHNPQLYRTVKNILDKTKNVKSEAAKSGDPNAGYMWTLEYGEKL